MKKTAQTSVIIVARIEWVLFLHGGATIEIEDTVANGLVVETVDKCS